MSDCPKCGNFYRECSCNEATYYIWYNSKLNKLKVEVPKITYVTFQELWDYAHHYEICENIKGYEYVGTL